MTVERMNDPHRAAWYALCRSLDQGQTAVLMERIKRERADERVMVAREFNKGERPCESCQGRGAYAEVSQYVGESGRVVRCEGCDGTGKARADRLVSRNAVVEALRAERGRGIFGDAAADFIEREFGGTE